MGVGHRYEAVSESDDTKDTPQIIRIPARIPWWKILLCNLVAACAGAGIMYALLSHTATPAPAEKAAASIATPSAVPTTDLSAAVPDKEEKVSASTNPLADQILDCGHSPEEARAKGCIYDVMMQDWIPEPCYDAELTEKYLAEGNWTWYGDWEGKKIISDEEMRKGEHGNAWMANSYHKAHCVFSWQKIIRALRHDKGISQELLSYDHVMHCSMGALKINEGLGDIGVSAPTNYAKCALYNTWLEHPIPDKDDHMD